MSKLSLQDLVNSNSINGKTVLVRVDFNVPLDKDGKITDNKRISETLPTIKAISDNGGKCVLMSHLGRPKGEKKPEFSLKPVADELSRIYNKPVLFSDYCISDMNKDIIESMNLGDVLLLENLRFYKEEEKNDSDFAGKLASLGDLYINDAFGTAHRAHASTEGITHFIDTCAAGYLMEKEIKYLSEAVDNPKRPLCAILGGSKISGKIDVLENLLNKADYILVGGGMMFTFYKALGYNIGKSILEEDKVGLAGNILEKAKALGKEIKLPVDVLYASEFSEDAQTRIFNADNLEANCNQWLGVDIGPETIREYSEVIRKSKTIIWNGPMGVFEIRKFANGTFEIAKALSEVTDNGAITIIGGGDSASAISKAGLEKSVTHVSTGGGASLEYLEGKKLPGIEALTDK